MHVAPGVGPSLHERTRGERVRTGIALVGVREGHRHRRLRGGHHLPGDAVGVRRPVAPVGVQVCRGAHVRDVRRGLGVHGVRGRVVDARVPRVVGREDVAAADDGHRRVASAARAGARPGAGARAGPRARSGAGPAAASAAPRGTAPAASPAAAARRAPARPTARAAARRAPVLATAAARPGVAAAAARRAPSAAAAPLAVVRRPAAGPAPARARRQQPQSHAQRSHHESAHVVSSARLRCEARGHGNRPAPPS